MEEGLHMTPELIEDYLQARRLDGLTEETIQTYRGKLNKVYGFLPEDDKTIYRGTIRSLAETIRERGFSNTATNVLLSAANMFVIWCQRPELQTSMRLENETVIQPEISRAEYLRLLSAAKAAGRERDYLIIKTIVLTGVRASELVAMTVEDAEHGWVTSRDENRRIPVILKQELLSFAKRNGILSGPLFRGNRETGICRSGVVLALNSLAGLAQVDEKKCNPRCLRRLYQQTQEQYQEMAQTIVDQARERMLENEQRVYGWGA